MQFSCLLFSSFYFKKNCQKKRKKNVMICYIMLKSVLVSRYYYIIFGYYFNVNCKCLCAVAEWCNLPVCNPANWISIPSRVMSIGQPSQFMHNCSINGKAIVSLEPVRAQTSSEPNSREYRSRLLHGRQGQIYQTASV